MARASDASWVTSKVAMPAASMRARNSPRKATRSSWSSAEKGSSSSKTLGLVMSARASATRCCSPPDKLQTRRLAYAPMPNKSNMCCACARAWYFSKRCSMRPKATLSSTLRCANSAKSWNIKAKRRRSGANRVMSWASNKTWPASGNCKPATIFKSVLFPLPDAPKSATISPGATFKLTSLSSLRSSKDWLMARSSSMLWPDRFAIKQATNSV